MKNRRFVKKVTDMYGTEPNEEIRDILEYLPSASILNFPYAWTENVYKYESDLHKYDVLTDDDSGFPYVILNGKKCYFPHDMSLNRVYWYASYLNGVEQHAESPHLYLTSEFDVACDDIVADCGSADGNFGLQIVDRVKKLYLFEPDERWQEPLRKTFEPWGDKVEIVQKMISDVETNDTVTLDGFFEGKEGPTFIKVDVEGRERNLLEGAENMVLSGIQWIWKMRT